MTTAPRRRIGFPVGLAAAALVGVGVSAPHASARNNDPPAPTEREPGPPTSDQDAQRGPGVPYGSRDWLARQWPGLSKEERTRRLREFLEFRRDRLDRTQKAIAHALKSMDEGVDPDRVLSEFPMELRPDARPGPGRAAGPRGARDDGRPEGDPVLNDPDRLGPASPGGDEMRPSGDRRLGPGAGGARGPVTDADREAFDEFLGSAAPRLQGLMRQLRQSDPEKADRKVREAMVHMRGLLELREKDRAMYDLRLRDIRAGREAMEAARAVVRHDRDHPNHSDAEGRERLIGELRRSLENQYDVRGEILAREVSRMQSELARRQDDLSKRPAGEQAAIDHNVDSLLRRAAERWPGPPGGGPDDAPPPPPRNQPPSAGESGD